MYDKYNRHINYLRISVTDKCNLRCVYCMPQEGIDLLKHEDILSYEEIVEIVKYGVAKGIDKIRLTGGEPLVRRDITRLIEMISQIEGVKDLSVTTNGILLGEIADEAAKAGLSRVNVSLDTLDPEKYKKITRGGDVNRVIEGLHKAKQAGLTPVKINMVVGSYTTDKDKEDLKNFCSRNNFELRFIQEMDLKKGTFSIVEGGRGGDCKRCNRLRLTANGMIKPCLFSDIAYNVRELGVDKAFQLALNNKPKAGTVSSACSFYRIGG